jgi:hypothetical protein
MCVTLVLTLPWHVHYPPHVTHVSSSSYDTRVSLRHISTQITLACTLSEHLHYLMVTTVTV